MLEAFIYVDKIWDNSQMKEKNIQTLFGQHLRITSPPLTNAFELKIVKNNKPFAFKQVKPHQIAGLKRAKEGWYYKLSDYTLDVKPFDCFWMKADHAWVVIHFYHPRAKKKVYAIEVSDFEKLMSTWKRKSIHEEELMPTGLVRILNLKSKNTQPPKNLQS